MNLLHLRVNSWRVDRKKVTNYITAWEEEVEVDQVTSTDSNALSEEGFMQVVLSFLNISSI